MSENQSNKIKQKMKRILYYHTFTLPIYSWNVPVC